MKKIAKITLFLMFLFIFPAISFACGEVVFDDVPYVSSLETSQKIVERVDTSRDYMLRNITLKMKLKTINTYKYLGQYGKDGQTVRDEIVTTLGKLTDNPSVAIIEKTRYVDDKKICYEKYTYSHAMLDAVKTRSYLYSYVEQYNEDGEIETHDYNRTNYNHSTTDLISIYNEAVPVIKANYVDSVSEKEFEGIKYYKLTSDIDGLESIKNIFAVDSNLCNNNNYQLFAKQNLNDYVKPFSCEVGLKNYSGSEYEYITYSTLNYKIEDRDRNVYLIASSKTELIEYGESVLSSTPENKDEYTVYGFIKTMKDKNYVIYETANPTNRTEYMQYTVADVEDGYSIVEKRFVPGSPTEVKNYFYSNSEAKWYELNVSNKIKTEKSSGLALDYINFDFDQEGEITNDEGVYSFKDKTNPANEITISLADGEIFSATTNSNTIYVVEYGTDIEKLGLVTSLEGFSAS